MEETLTLLCKVIEFPYNRNYRGVVPVVAALADVLFSNLNDTQGVSLLPSLETANHKFVHHYKGARTFPYWPFNQQVMLYKKEKERVVEEIMRRVDEAKVDFDDPAVQYFDYMRKSVKDCLLHGTHLYKLKNYKLEFGAKIEHFMRPGNSAQVFAVHIGLRFKFVLMFIAAACGLLKESAGHWPHDVVSGRDLQLQYAKQLQEAQGDMPLHRALKTHLFYLTARAHVCLDRTFMERQVLVGEDNLLHLKMDSSVMSQSDEDEDPSLNDSSTQQEDALDSNENANILTFCIQANIPLSKVTRMVFPTTYSPHLSHLVMLEAGLHGLLSDTGDWPITEEFSPVSSIVLEAAAHLTLRQLGLENVPTQAVKKHAGGSVSFPLTVQWTYAKAYNVYEAVVFSLWELIELCMLRGGNKNQRSFPHYYWPSISLEMLQKIEKRIAHHVTSSEIQFHPAHDVISKELGVADFDKSITASKQEYWKILGWPATALQTLVEKHGQALLCCQSIKVYNWESNPPTFHRGYEPILCFFIEKNGIAHSVISDFSEGQPLTERNLLIEGSQRTYTPDLHVPAEYCTESKWSHWKDCIIEVKCLTSFLMFERDFPVYSRKVESIFQETKSSSSCRLF